MYVTHYEVQMTAMLNAMPSCKVNGCENAIALIESDECVPRHNSTDEAILIIELIIYYLYTVNQA